MKYKKITNCTVLLISHERPELLNKALDYYKEFFTNIKVLDSSFKKNRFIKSQYDYHHCKNQGAIEKTVFGLSNTKTEFTIIAPDDDFFLPDSVKTGIKFLKKESDYVSVGGKYYSFEKIGFLKKFNLMYKDNYNSNSEILPLKRLKNICTKPIAQMTYNLFRTKTIYKSLFEFRYLKQISFLEATATLANILFGKHKYLNINWMIRDGSVNTIYSTNIDQDGLFKYKKKNTKLIFKKFLKSYYLILKKCNIEFNKKLIEKYLNKYFSSEKKNISSLSNSLKLIRVLKKIYKFFWYSILTYRYWLFFSNNEKKFLRLIFKK
jgi:glycosyltransferase domain-containing protein